MPRRTQKLLLRNVHDVPIFSMLLAFLVGLSASANAGPGAWDTTYQPTVSGGAINAMLVQSDGKLIIGGAFFSVNNSSSRSHLARLYSDGSLDNTFFNGGSGVSSTVWSLALQTDGRIILGGDFLSVSNVARTRVARLNVNGSVDGTFVPTNSINASVLAVAAQSDNKVIIGGLFNGGLFPSYNARLNADGSVDTAFSSFPNGPVNAIAVQSDGKIILGGQFTTLNGATRNRIGRLNADGSLDNTFQNGLAGASSTVRCLLVQTDGKILVGGDFTILNNSGRAFLARLNSDGSLDSFASAANLSGSVYALALQTDSSVLIGGAFTSIGQAGESRVARLYPDGTRDPAFLPPFLNASVLALGIQPDGGVLIGGAFTTIGTSNRLYLARLYGNLYPPEFVTQPLSRATNVGATVTFSAQVSNPTPTYFQWRKDGVNINGATDNSYSLFNIQLADAGNYSVFANNAAGGVTSSNALLQVGVAPAITQHPVSLSVTQGQSAMFSVTASGTPLNYYWRKNGAFISGATNSSISFSSTVFTNGGVYSCLVSNFLGTATSSNAVLTVASAPSITTQPANATLPVGSTVSLSVTATGTAPLAYQWFKDTNLLNDATNSAIIVTNAQVSDSGGYFLLVSNYLGMATSAVAQVSIGLPPVLTQQPLSFTNNPAESNAFTVSVSGDSPLLFQWFKDGMPIAAATNSSLTFPTIQTNQIGFYSVSISNPFGGTLSSNAFLALNGVPVPFQWVGLAAFYPLDATSKDLSANTNDGTASNCQPSTNKFGTPAKSFRFDGIDSQVVAADRDFLNLSSPGDFTISIWATRSSNQPWSFLVGKDAGNARSPATKWILIVGRYHDPNTPTLTFHFVDDSGALHWIGSSSIVEDFDVWHQYTITRSNSLFSIYVDAALVETESDVVDQAAVNPASLTIGSAEGGGWHNGLLNDLRIYNRPLSPAEVNDLYAYDIDTPRILAQPRSLIVPQNAPFSMNVTAVARNVLSYQWNKDALAITNALNPSLAFTNAQPSQAGLYTVSVSNGFTGVLSQPAPLTVISGSGPAAPGFTSNQFGFGLTGPSGTSITIETSTNLQTWVPLVTNTFGTNLLQFLDPASPSLPHRFYRLRY